MSNFDDQPGEGVNPADTGPADPDAVDPQAVADGHAGHLVVGPDGNTVTPTQVRKPSRATFRTMFQAALALATLIPLVVAGVYGDGDNVPAAVIQVVTVAGIITRVMALPSVEAFLQTYLPWLAATSKGDTA